MKSFRTLELSIEFYEQTESLSLKGHLKDQILRASSSICLNLSEGNAKRSVKEKKRYYQTAYASLQECKTALRLMKCDDEKLVGMADHLGACLYKLLNSKITTIPYSENG